LQNETVVARKGSDFVAVDDAKQLAEAQEKMAAVEKEVAEARSDLKNSLRKWFADETDRVKAEKEKVLTKVAGAKSKANEQRIREEEDRRERAAHYHPRRGYEDRTGRVAGADEKSAAQDRKAAGKNAQGVTREAKRELTQMDREINERNRELYGFALTALENSLPDDAVLSTKTPAAGKVPPPPKAEPSDGQKTFVVTYQTKNGKMHTEEIIAATAKEAKKKVREHHPHAVFKSIEVKQ
jgi:hypothetical protein